MIYSSQNLKRKMLISWDQAWGRQSKRLNSRKLTSTGEAITKIWYSIGSTTQSVACDDVNSTLLLPRGRVRVKCITHSNKTEIFQSSFMLFTFTNFLSGPFCFFSRGAKDFTTIVFANMVQLKKDHNNLIVVVVLRPEIVFIVFVWKCERMPACLDFEC